MHCMHDEQIELIVYEVTVEERTQGVCLDRLVMLDGTCI